jgi:hypothetical protein
MEAETVEDLKKALKDYGYSDKVVIEIIKWYIRGPPPELT